MAKANEVIVGHHYNGIDANGRSINYEVLSIAGDQVTVRDGSSVVKVVPIQVFIPLDDSFMRMDDMPHGEEVPAE